MAKKKPYADQPHAPASKIAGKPLVQNASLGNNEMPTIVPPVAPAGRPPIGGAHGYGHKPSQHAGKLRLSGSVKAHKFGGK